MTDRLTALFEAHFNESVETINALPAHGSNRLRYRLACAARTVIGVVNADRAENIAFLTFCRHFYSLGLPVPQVYAVGPDENIYLEEDLGDQTLFDLLQTNRKTESTFPEEIEDVYKRVVQQLPEFQIRAGASLDYSVCYPRDSFDRQSIMWDLNYFKYYFMKLADIAFNEQQLEDDFHNFCDFLLAAPRDFFLYRDFQSRNIMIRNGRPSFIDFQGGRRGALQYDIASLLYDAKANLPSEVRDRLLTDYLEAVQKLSDIEHAMFMKYYYGYVLVRILQAMGAYGFRGFYERKTHFLQSVPYAIRNLEYLLDNTELEVDLPMLLSCLRAIVRSTRLRELGQVSLPVTVRIQSFSYRGGVPEDDSGHGGGFVFDCRSLPNPGRLQAYKDQNGNDPGVIAFLEKQEEVHSFLTRVRDLISQVIENYQKRNFSHLFVAFGCTGGQHRSVYCANQLAKFLHAKDHIKVELSHREKQQWPAHG